MWPEKLLILVMFVLVFCENGKGSGKVGQSRRRPKLFTFNNVDDKIDVNLEFSIPFITISTKKSIDAVSGSWPADLPSVNINPGSLAVGGAVVLATTLLIPVFMKNYAAGHGHDNHQNYGRLLDSAEFSTDAVLDFATRVLTDNQVVRGCALKISCWAGQKANYNSTRIWNQITRNDLFSSILNSTAVEDAILSGKNGRDCNTFGPCPLREEHLPFL